MNTSKKSSILAIFFMAIAALTGCAAVGYPYGYDYGGSGYGYRNQPYYASGNSGGYGRYGYSNHGYGNYGGSGYGYAGHRHGHHDYDHDGD